MIDETALLSVLPDLKAIVESIHEQDVFTDPIARAAENLGISEDAMSCALLIGVGDEVMERGADGDRAALRLADASTRGFLLGVLAARREVAETLA